MKQHGNERWHGHREITHEAVGRLFDERADADGTIRGVDARTYARALDHGQARQDRLVSVGLIRGFSGTRLTTPYVGLGPTAHSAWANPRVQREHFMADPYRGGPENLRLGVAYVLIQAAAARQARARAGGRAGRSSDSATLRREMRHLGTAVHALQDSYSGAHVWRDDAVYSGDPTAAVLSLQVFTPGHAIGFDDGRNTHADEFDMPPTASGSARAAVEATLRMLVAHERGLDLSPQRADVAMHDALTPMLRAAGTGVVVNLKPDARWERERDRRLALERGAVLRSDGPAT